MPSYSYECPKCGHYLEVVQKMSDEKLTDCPGCNQPTLQRLIGSSVSVDFKGSWGDKRRRKVDARKKRQETRPEKPVATGKMSKAQVHQMAKMRDKYAKSSPYLNDPQEQKEKRRKEYPDNVRYDSSKPPVEPELGGDSRKSRNQPNDI